LRALAIPEIAACRTRLVPELTVFSARADDDFYYLCRRYCRCRRVSASRHYRSRCRLEDGRQSKCPANRALSRATARLPLCHWRFRSSPCLRYHWPGRQSAANIPVRCQCGLDCERYADAFIFFWWALFSLVCQLEGALRFLDDSPLEGARFEPSVPDAKEAAPFRPASRHGWMLIVCARRGSHSRAT